MPSATRIAKTFSIDKELLRRIERGKGKVSTSERVNQLLHRGLEIEQAHALHREAEEFFRTESDLSERKAFQAATIRAISRD